MRKGGWIPADHWGRLFLRGASAEVKLVACYLMTCAHSGAGGVVRAEPGVMCADLGLLHSAFIDALEALVRRRFVVPYVEIGPGSALSACHAWAVPAILDAEPIANPNVGKRVVKDLADLLDGGSGDFWRALLDAYRSSGAEKNLAPEFFARVVEAATWEGQDSAGNYALAIDDQRRKVASTVVTDALAGVDTYDALGGAQPDAKTEPICKPPDPAPEAWLLIESWNRVALEVGLDVASLLDDELMSAAAARVAQLGGVENIPALINKVRASEFLMGRRPGADGNLYRLTFAAMCRESMFVKIMEGAYDTPPEPDLEIPDFLRRGPAS